MIVYDLGFYTHIHLNEVVGRKVNCGNCDGCLAQDCGKCILSGQGQVWGARTKKAEVPKTEVHKTHCQGTISPNNIMSHVTIYINSSILFLPAGNCG